MTQPTSVTAGAALSPTLAVAVQDDAGNIMTSSTATVSVALASNAGGGTLAGTTSAQAVNGIATFPDLHIDKAALAYTLTASSSGLTSATSGGFDIVASAPKQLVFVSQPTASVAGVSMSPQITVAIRDSLGNPTASTSSVVVAIGNNAGSGTLGGTLTVSAVGGTATFSLVSIDKTGVGYTLAATSTGLTTATSGGFTISHAAAAKLAFDVQPTDVQGSQPFSPQVLVSVRDAFGNLVTSATNEVTLTIGNAPEEGSWVEPAQGGVVGFGPLAPRRPSTVALYASSGTLTPATSAAFAVHLTFVNVSADSALTCGVTSLHISYCWGDQFDQTPATSSSPVPVQTPYDPVTYQQFPVTWASVGTGRDGSCGLDATGAAYCWGTRALENGGFDGQSFPVAVPGGRTYAALDEGWFHTCAITAAGALWCWGFNSANQLGDGTNTNRSTPVPIAAGTAFSAIGSGRYHTCALTIGGAAQCWGNGSHGQLGDNTVTFRTTPGPVVGGLTLTAISAGGNFTPSTGAGPTIGGTSCALATGGAAHCWGSNESGQVGDGTTTERSVPTAVTGGLTFTRVSVGSRHTCALTSAGVPWCWGANASGQLGDATTANKSSPTAVSGGLLFTGISAGDSHTCGVTSAGDVYCWGLNTSGQLGEGTYAQRLVPTRIVQ